MYPILCSYMQAMLFRSIWKLSSNMRYSFIGECLLCLQNSNLGYCVEAGTKRPPADAALLHIIIIIIIIYTMPRVCVLYNTYRYILYMCVCIFLFLYLYVLYTYTYRSRQDMLRHSSSLCLGEYEYKYVRIYITLAFTWPLWWIRSACMHSIWIESERKYLFSLLSPSASERLVHDATITAAATVDWSVTV